MARAKDLHYSNYVIGNTTLNNWLKTLNGKSVGNLSLMPMFHKDHVEVWAFLVVFGQKRDSSCLTAFSFVIR